MSDLQNDKSDHADPVLLAQELAGYLIATEDHPHRVMWKWPFRLSIILRNLGGTPGDYTDAILAFARDTEMPYEDVLLGVSSSWDKVNHPKGPGRLAAAFLQAKQHPITFHLPSATGPKFLMLASIAYHLTFFQAGEPIFLPRKILAKLIGASPITVSRIVSLLVKDGFLRQESGYDYAKKRCKTYTVCLPPGGEALITPF